MDPFPLSEFEDFFRGIHGQSPFKWQKRLLEEVVQADWPSALDIPTGAGKTAAIDVAVFHMAFCAARNAWASVRIAFVVDRRIVVDDAYNRAKKIADALKAPSNSSIEQVARALTTLAGEGEPPLSVARLRGGLAKEPDWARTPVQPTVLVSTVDQIGSRLLFRGYGISPNMRPIHAGLLGTDTLILLDEAHLSKPFEESIRSIENLENGRRDRLRPFTKLTSLSATLTQPMGNVFRLSKAKGEEDEEELAKRLRASKPVLLIEEKSKSDDSSFAERLADLAIERSRLRNGEARVVGIIVNRVRRARAVFEALEHRAKGEAEIHLLIGPSREVQRNAELEHLLPRISATRRNEPDDVIFVVATQTIEAGADLDFDALVTEAAALDALRQRFGRVNRVGRRSLTASSAIVAAKDHLARGNNDPVYGTAIATTWQLLQEHAQSAARKEPRSIDFGVIESRAWMPKTDQLPTYLGPRPDAPVMVSSFIRIWNRTSAATPRGTPPPEPECAVFLHGMNPSSPDVEIVWRADLDNEQDRWLDRVQACPPSALEAVSVPIWALKRWFSQEDAMDFSDVEGEAYEETAGNSERYCVRWEGAESKVVRIDNVRPGDLLIVPARYGGCDIWGWNPADAEPVRDVAREANQIQRRRDILRLHRTVVAQEIARERARPAGKIERSEPIFETANEMADRFDRWLDDRASFQDTLDADVIAQLRSCKSIPEEWAARIDNTWNVLRDSNNRVVAIQRKMKQMDDTVGAEGLVAETEDDQASLGMSEEGRPVPLELHSNGVGTYASRYARLLSLRQEIREDIVLAAYLHDTGKAHRAFQRWMRGGDRVAAILGPPLAKSGRRLPPRVRDAAGLPKNARHEIASIFYALASPLLEKAHDPELVLWLIGTHHGYGRPWFSEADWPLKGEQFECSLNGDTTSVDVTKDAAGVQAAWYGIEERLYQRYGPWTLAYMETIVRLADHRRSEDEQRAESHALPAPLEV